ncbi:DUF368 domain-containing protein [Tuanshanicoccus lijuaniae]|uniref:DUF368 domain-containing protein n=1 Tax=Aerococcaceae bacterium zg-1292 TaxID=2774330 RepID=UPI004063F954
MELKQEAIMQETQTQSWFIRFIKGMFIGSGFIIPGVSGGAFAAIFGMYERIILFLSNITKNFKENVLFFIPVGFGALAGIVFLSFGVSFVLENYETIVRWFFVGCIVGTAPSLWQETGKQGRETKDWIVLVISIIAGLIILLFGQQLFQGQLQGNFVTWFISGALIALGILIPGLSPSNFILYMGLYQQMSDGFKTLDLSVLIPIGLGGLTTVILLSKLIAYIFKHYYSLFFHFIFGIVIASTVVIIPTDYANFGFAQYVWCVISCIAGALLGLYMAKLEDQYK